MSFYYLLYLWLIYSSKVPVTKIARANELILEAENSYKEGQYVAALVKYRYLTNFLQFRDAPIQINLAHCYFLNNDNSQAQKFYLPFVNSSNTAIRSIACHQLGVIAFEEQKYTVALEYFRKSLMANPESEESRYNYELVSKLLPQAKEPDEPAKQKQKKPENKQDNPPPPVAEENMDTGQAQNPGSEKQKNSETQKQQIIRQKLKQMNLTEEKAQMILDAMKNSEIQYIQQRKKHVEAKEDKNLPDW